MNVIRPGKASSRGSPSTGRVALAVVHHANQFVITNGYDNREGIDDLVGDDGAGNSYSKIIDLHLTYGIPVNLNFSGTLLEALLWHRPDFFERIRELDRRGLLGWIGSAYGQNIMRFFSPEHNRRQVAETLELYRRHLGVDPTRVKVFWPPERVWDTEALSAVLTDTTLANGGYDFVLMDDRLLYPLSSDSVSRDDFDQQRSRRHEDFIGYRIADGGGLTALPISMDLRQSIPPWDESCLSDVGDLLYWLAKENDPTTPGRIAIFGDDLEKTAGVAGWDERGPERYESFLRWLSDKPWIEVVKLGEWAAAQPPAAEKRIDVGTFLEMKTQFNAGDNYENWYYSEQWEPYRGYCDWAERSVEAATGKGANGTLIELAWKQLMVSGYETAWHTPDSGVHGDPGASGHPSPWAKAVASHSRIAAVIAEAAAWMVTRDGSAHAALIDIDGDGNDELVLKNDKLFAVFSPAWGGRLLYLFTIGHGADGTPNGAADGAMVVGNPCDDWNWMEELNKHMAVPASHPGALADVGFENDRYETRIDAAAGAVARVTFVNVEDDSRAAGMEKAVSLAQGAETIDVSYRLPEHLSGLVIECGMSPDYLDLLRSGRGALAEFSTATSRGYANNGVAVWLDLGNGGAPALETGSAREFAHGMALRIFASDGSFGFKMGAGRPPAEAS